jgi:hypothetical protein
MIPIWLMRTSVQWSEITGIKGGFFPDTFIITNYLQWISKKFLHFYTFEKNGKRGRSEGEGNYRVPCDYLARQACSPCSKCESCYEVVKRAA